MSDIQTRKNALRDSRNNVGYCKNYVSQITPFSADVPALFAKTAGFSSKHLAASVKTILAPDPRQRTEGLTKRVGGSHG